MAHGKVATIVAVEPVNLARPSLCRWGAAFLLAACLASAPAGVAHAGKYDWRVLKHISLDLRTEKPTFVCLSTTLLDRGHLLNIGRPLEDRSALTMLDLDTMEITDYHVPEIPGPWVPPKDMMVVDVPLFYDRQNGMAGLLLRAGGLVSGDALFAEWDLQSNRITRRLPLAKAAGAPWTSVKSAGYDPERRECYVEILRPRAGPGTDPNRGGQFDVSIIGVTDRVRPIASFHAKAPFGSKGPYYDSARHRSMHVEYREHGVTTAYLVDLDTGVVREYELPPIIYGFAFDPDGKTAYVYTYPTSEVFKLDLTTGNITSRRRYGRPAHSLEFIAPNTLVLMHNTMMHFIDSRTLRERFSLPPSRFHQGLPHLEGSYVLPGRILARIYYQLYVIDFPGLKPASPGGTQ